MLLKVTTQSKNESESTLKLPPGPRKVPFIGHLHLLASYNPPHRTLRDLALKYGSSLMHLQLGEVSTVIVSSPEAAKQILKTHDVIFASRPSLLATEIICYDNTNIAFAPYGEYWRELRKICTLELLSIKRVQSLWSVREEEFSNLCRWIISNEGSSINLTERVNLTTYEVITRASIGKKNEEQATFISVLKEVIELASGFHICDVYPSIKLGILFKFKEVLPPSDMPNGSNSNFTWCAKQDMFSAGSETSATTIDWAMSEMLKNPQVLEKAQEEVRKVFKEKGYVDEIDFQELKDPKYWKEAESFIPERYLESSVDYKGNNFEYIPFGAGRRICPGMSFGLANVELPLAMFLYHFDWILPNGMKPEQIDMKESFGATARRKYPLYVIPVVKKPLQVK
ncbi:hypothetical protein ACJIZ3_007012 [Penstemon smallii]|uniref:Cytochrome P450 n=1 Tax=Penstemon smallii TaxID=265156 RepID=A0ABD3S9T4_9LAMI